MLYQPSNISPDEIYGTGTVDITDDLDISWRVSGDSAMTAYKIDFFANDAASTALYSTGKVTLATPFWGVNYAGETQYYTATVASSALTGAGMVNGNEYKFLITQWWSADNSVQQFTASVFLTRSAPSLTISTIPNPLEERMHSFTATYSQAQGDSIAWVRWQLADSGNEANPFYDSGPIYGTGELQMDYDGFLNGNSYAVQCTVETENRIQVTTGWTDFSVEYSVSAATGNVTACQIAGDACVWVSWDRDVTADGYSVMRQEAGGTRLVKIADLPATSGQIRDYGAHSGTTYTYYVFPSGPLSYITEPMVSAPVNVQFWGWVIVEAEPTETENEYNAIRSYIFKYGSGGVSEGQFSNNNSPQISSNFTRYPTRQGTTANYLTGSVSGLIGTVSTAKEYTDTISQSDAIFQLSNSQNALFLHDPKGHFLRIHTSGAVTLNINNKTRALPQTMTIPWTEIGTTENVHVIMYPGGDFYPLDKIIYTTVNVDPVTGMLVWTVPDEYVGETSTLYMQDGILYQNDDGPFDPATLSINSEKQLIATVED